MKPFDRILILVLAVALFVAAVIGYISENEMWAGVQILLLLVSALWYGGKAIAQKNKGAPH